MTNRQRRTTSLLLAATAVVSSLTPTTAFGISKFVNNAAPVLSNSMADIAEAVNGETYLEIAPLNGDAADDDSPAVSCSLDKNLTLDDDRLEPVLPFAPPLTYAKFLTMQDKRVSVTIQYSSECGLKPYFMTVAKKIKDSHPDVLLERRILPAVSSEGDEEPTFEVVVDDKVIVSRNRRLYNNNKGETSVFVNMQEVGQAITRARRKRRPSTSYGEEAKSIRLNALRNKDRKEDKDSGKQ